MAGTPVCSPPAAAAGVLQNVCGWLSPSWGGSPGCRAPGASGFSCYHALSCQALPQVARKEAASVLELTPVPPPEPGPGWTVFGVDL